MDSKLQEVIETESRRLDGKAVAIRAKYGDWLTDYEVSLVEKAEKENSVCRNCTGLPCKKKFNPNFQRAIKIPENSFTLYVKDKPCKHFLPSLKQKELNKTFKGAEIPEHYVGLTFADYAVDSKNKIAVEVAKKLIDDLDKGAFFYGNYGTGKTMLAAIIAQEHLRRGRSVLFSQLPEILRSVRATFNKESKLTDIDVLEKLYKVPILIIDDITATRQKKFASETLFSIVNARYNARLQTIMTSNDTLRDVANALDNPLDTDGGKDGSRIYDRCKAMCFPVKLEGDSRR